MIQLQDITLQRGRQVLLDSAEMTVYAGQRVGLIGSNGAGKTSLFLLLQGDLNLEHGNILFSPKLKWAHIQQSMPQGEQSALDYTLEGDKEWHDLQVRLKQAESDDDGFAIADIHNRLGEIDGYSAPSKAAKILLGLGFTQSQLHDAVNTFSGGWRMRLSLARVLISRADVFLLDEPTNHLDLEAILWLQAWLKQSLQTIILISHDREFLDDVITHTVHLYDRKLKNYVGNYSAFERQRSEQLAIQQATFSKQQKSRAHLQKFVDRFRAKASKAKQAQSRMKMLERMELVADVRSDNPFRFAFKAPKKAGNPMLQMRNVNVGYDDSDVLQGIKFSLRDGDRIGLLGPNGAGKSTFIKLLARELEPRSGDFIIDNKIKIGYFAQQQLEQIDFSLNPLQCLLQIDKKIGEAVARKFLHGFNFTYDDLNRPASEFSSGQRARLILALIIWEAPNLLLLDEPTNHLDLEMREALNLALQEYEGAMVLVSHDRHLLKSAVDEFYLVAEGEVQPFDGDIDDYHAWLKQNYW